MSWITFSRIFKLGSINFWRNRWLSIAATLIMTLTLLIISVFMIITLVIGKTNESIKSKMDIKISFKESATVDQITNLQQKLATRSDIKEVRYETKEEAVANFKEIFKGWKAVENPVLEEKPLLRSLEVKTTDAQYLENIANFVNQDEYKPIIENVSYKITKKTIDRIIGFTSLTNVLGWGLCIVFIFISIVVILNTISLTIFARREEIEIMRLVGASNVFIKVPFIVEGFFYGILATLLAATLLRFGVVIISNLTQRFLPSGTSLEMIKFVSSNFLMIIGLDLLIGVFVGIICSLIGIRKYLRI